MNVPVDCNNGVERKNTHPLMIADEDDHIVQMADRMVIKVAGTAEPVTQSDVKKETPAVEEFSNRRLIVQWPNEL